MFLTLPKGSMATAVIETGTLPSYDLDEDGEAGLLLDTFTMAFRRTYETKRNANKSTVFHRGVDPMVEITAQGRISGATRVTFSAQHPGTTILALSNYSVTIRGFSPSAGKLIFEDVEDTLNNVDSTPTMSMTIKHYPLMA